ncbi:MAG: hypothetical protein M3Q98_15020 [Actinomycetota bacterium]|nr:hypothetical protein [Actinomycetota bacterium]
MTYQGPQDPDLRERWRHARREVARTHHPDTGGDTAVYLALMSRLDLSYMQIENQHLQPGRVTSDITIVRSDRWWQRFRRRLPRRWPGGKRYIEL